MTTQTNKKVQTPISRSADAEFVSTLDTLAANPSTPLAYRDIFKKVVLFSRELINERDAESNKASDHLRKITSVYDQYRVLEDLYKVEHKKVLDQEDQKALLEIKLAEKQKELDAALQQTAEANKKIEQLIEEHRRTAQRQGVGRKNIEDKLYNKDRELDEMKRKYQELEHAVTKFSIESERLKKENNQFKLLLAYLQSSQVYPPQQPQPQ
ncbi:hypothetical protein A0J61_03771 [Choanephora cucurbitarum]|uniref:Uncharacterized protein n=1 Tax=Choanephora cucurbitarum TaxID=101091 RepID=A0A1C7NGU3_9FUNG|nr:hypothetical protein A0J61_05365 [Choanephora cucurbitarum]OBZ88190.1 hypothetical protein A0J61_03771 [Choanephora cucurbitarum]